MPLVDPDGNIRLADGTLISTATGGVVKDDIPEGFEEVPAPSVAVKQLERIKRNIEDLPELPERMNPISAVLSYHLFGLRPIDIAAVSGLSETQVQTILDSDAFKTMLGRIVETIYTHDSDNVRALFYANAQAAAQKMANLVNSDSEGVAMAASKDILDRSGHTVKQIVEHQHRMEGGLTIEIVHKNKENELPVLDLQPTLIGEQ